MASTPILWEQAVRSHRVSSRTTLRQFHSMSRWQEQYFNANQETFNKVALNKTASDKVVLVDFYADWCNPCKMISPILEKLTSDAAVKTGSGRSLDLVTVNTDEEFDLAQKYKIRSLPTVVAFKDGKVADQFIGALNEVGIRKFLEKV
ncbi:thioredoxin-like protein [Leucogyrophana mollusca]|uniref:Thioredoxin-like protein n=1 Tax=Leucogyrophana mollusca TaxID=85980 RepID=A0ACB8BNE1_9AGAM|nr:thioredoxin-like protein [Leucogyrophana mollusca]